MWLLWWRKSEWRHNDALWLKCPPGADCGLFLLHVYEAASCVCTCLPNATYSQAVHCLRVCLCVSKCAQFRVSSYCNQSMQCTRVCVCVRLCTCVWKFACKRQPVGNFWVNRVETVVWRRVSLISGLCVYKCVPVCVRRGHCLFRMVITELPWGVCWKRGHRVNCSTQTNTHYKAARLTVTPDKIMYKPREFTL